ncbi:hypothetical protein [Hyphomonas sp. GM-8P]|uniref:hypothetical protein n=1 Tax=Hyphomonas sp. GM-8P TaxID=1280945 RepID=UPI00131412D1|nr:hypothetical protein [Hyphomonas sp. GM-8P]
MTTTAVMKRMINGFWSRVVGWLIIRQINIHRETVNIVASNREISSRTYWGRHTGQNHHRDDEP